MAHIPPTELADIHYVYGLCDGNAAEAARIYAERFPNRRHPDRKTFIRTHRRFREGTLFMKDDHPGNVQLDVEVDEAILEAVEEQPGTSTRRVAGQLGVSKSKVLRVLKADRQHPYHYTPVQDLLPGDYPLRVDFCRDLLQRANRDAAFLGSILWTDEAQFTRDGVTNFHNLHEWSHENPHNKKPTAFQHRFSVNVWAAVLGNTLFGPKILPPRLNSENYLAFLMETVPEILEDLPVADRRRLVYQQDGAPAHYGIIVRDWLNNNYPQRWIGRGGPIPWPPRSPDLTPLDFYLWSRMKDYVYSVELQTREQLIQRIEEAGAEVRENLQQFDMNNAVKRRLEYCLIEDGKHIEHLL